MAPLNKRDLKKDTILEAGLRAMQAHGYNGTSVKDIVQAADVPKGSFYNYFSSKEEFAIHALQRANEADMALFREYFDGDGRSPLDKVYNYFQFCITGHCDNEFRCGSFLGNLCQEMADHSNGLRDALHEALTEQTTMLGNILEQARQAGQLAEDTDTQSLGEFLFNAWQGALLRMKATRSRVPLDSFITQMSQLFRQIPPDSSH